MILTVGFNLHIYIVSLINTVGFCTFQNHKSVGCQIKFSPYFSSFPKGSHHTVLSQFFSWNLDTIQLWFFQLTTQEKS